MKWITREYVKVDRVACPWLIKKFVDKDAEFIFVPADKVMDEAKRLDAIPYDVKNVELGHHGKECSFEAIFKEYNDPALVLLGKIVNAADTDNTLYRQPEGPGLEAIAEGFRHLGYKNDHEVNAAEWIVYDALYAYCREMVKAGKPDGDFHHHFAGIPVCNRVQFWSDRDHCQRLAARDGAANIGGRVHRTTARPTKFSAWRCGSDGLHWSCIPDC
jgi:hypothetical protein